MRMKYINFKLLIFFAALALAIPPAWAETVTDVINRDVTLSYLKDTGNSSWASDFSVTFDSGAEYYIHSMGLTGLTAPALNWNKNGYLYATKSGGKLKSVIVAGDGSENKTVDVYASNTVYTAAPSGSYLARVKLTDSGTTYNFDDDYTFIAIKGNSSSTRPYSITIVWEVQDPSAPVITVLPPSLTINDATGDDVDKTGTLTATLTNGQGAITAATNPSDKWSWNNNTVTFNGNELGAEGTVTFSSTGATNVTADLEYNYTGPLYIIGTVNGRTDWAPNNYVQMERDDDGLYTVTLTTPSGDQGKSWISFTKRVANDNDGSAWNYIAPYRFSVLLYRILL